MAASRKSRIRIIGGKWRGRKLDVIDSEGLRPTPDRIRETLFNWLAPYCPGAMVLDCFAGSGTTLICAEELGRRWIGMDNSPWAIQATLKRLAEMKKLSHYKLYKETSLNNSYKNELIPESSKR